MLQSIPLLILYNPYRGFVCLCNKGRRFTVLAVFTRYSVLMSTMSRGRYEKKDL